MNRNPFTMFIDLVSLDQDIRSLEKECEQKAHDIKDAQGAKQSLYTKVDTLKAQLYDARKRVDLVELEMKSLDEKEKEKKERLESVSSLKEYDSVKLELESLQQKQQQKEQEVLDAWNKLDSAQDAVDAYDKEFSDKLEACENTIQEHTQHHTQCAQRLQDQKDMRPQKEQGIPSEWLEKYTIMRTQIADPVVPLNDEDCSACFHSATRQDIATIKRGALVQCKGCYRLLYDAQYMKAQDE